MATIGIDFGGSVSVMAMAGGGRIDIVRNDLSERLTPSLVGFTEAERTFGDVALSTVKTNVKNTCRNMKSLLGRSPESLGSEHQYAYAPLAESSDGFPGYEITSLGEKQVLSAVSVTAAYLASLKRLAERSLNTPVVEVVIGVPSWYTDTNLRSMCAAVDAAGLPCLRLFSEHAATALDYGIFRSGQFNAKSPQRVLFVDVGYTAASAYLVDFIPNELKVIAVETDVGLGGRVVDLVLIEMISKTINKKAGYDVTENPKVRLRIEEQATRAKHILSANSDATVMVERACDDDDVTMLITRDSFEEACIPVSERLRELIRKVLTANGDKHLYAVEAVGGSVRIPWMLDIILAESKEAFGPTETEPVVSRTLSQDETVARGCALQAAMLSRRFKVRDFNVVDCTSYGIRMMWSPDLPTLGHKSLEGAALASDQVATQSNHTVLEARHKYPCVSWVSFPLTGSLDVELQYDAAAFNLPFATSPLIGRYRIESSNSSKYSAKAKLKVKVGVDINRLVSLSAHVSDEEEYEEVTKETRPLSTPLATSTPPTQESTTAGQPPATGENVSPQEATPPPQTETVEVKKIKTRRVRHHLTTETIMCPGQLSQDYIKKVKDLEMESADADRVARDRRDILNELEAFGYSLRNELRNGQLSEFLPPASLNQLTQLLDETENWIYGEGQQAQKSVITAKLDDVKKLSDRGVWLMKESTDRASCYSQLMDQTRAVRTACMSTDDTYSHIPQEQKDGLFEKCANLEAWSEQMMAEQRRRTPYDDVAATTQDIKNKCQEFADEARKVLSQPKPTPPPSDPSPATTDVPADVPMPEQPTQEPTAA